MNSDNAPSGNRLKFLGIASIILGVIALATPAVAAGAVVIIVGATLLIAGISQVFQGFKGQGWRHKIMPMVLGIITGIAGIGVLAHPIMGLGVLSLLLAAYFVVEGNLEDHGGLPLQTQPGLVLDAVGRCFVAEFLAT